MKKAHFIGLGVVGNFAGHLEQAGEAADFLQVARKICEKKNWGTNSKGISATQIALNKFEQGGVLDSYNIACFHKRDDKLNAYDEDSPALSYSYFHQKLLN